MDGMLSSSPQIHVLKSQSDGETVEAVSDFIFLGSKITADDVAAMKLKDAYSLEGKLWPT